MTKTNMRCLAAALALAASIGWMAAPTMAADDSKVKSATRQVETGAKKIGDGKLGDGVEETAKGVGHTVVEGASVGAPEGRQRQGKRERVRLEREELLHAALLELSEPRPANHPRRRHR